VVEEVVRGTTVRCGAAWRVDLVAGGGAAPRRERRRGGGRPESTTGLRCSEGQFWSLIGGLHLT
jgi:hypothetical protein